MHTKLKKFWPGALLLLVLAVILEATHFIGERYGFNSIPAVQVLYWAADVGWMIKARGAVHFGVASSCVFIGMLLLSNIGSGMIRALKIRAIVVGVMMLITSAWNITMLGTVLYGGTWHFSAIVFGTLDALSIIAAAFILLGTQRKANLKSQYVKHH